MSRKKYRKREQQKIIAVQLALETDGFAYKKWGGTQKCSAGDWLVNNDGDCYTIAEQTFAATYRQTAPGQYVKIAPVWAEQADNAGAVATQEGATHYEAGDYIVSNTADGTDSYAVTRDKFEAMYAPAD